MVMIVGVLAAHNNEHLLLLKHHEVVEQTKEN